MSSGDNRHLVNDFNCSKKASLALTPSDAVDGTSKESSSANSPM